MKDLIVTIEGSSRGPIKASLYSYENEDYEILVLNDKEAVSGLLRDLNGAWSVEVTTQNQPLGTYTLLTGSSESLVLVRGNYESILKRLCGKS